MSSEDASIVGAGVQELESSPRSTGGGPQLGGGSNAPALESISPSSTLVALAMSLKVPVEVAKGLATAVGGGEDLLLEDFEFMPAPALEEAVMALTVSGQAATIVQKGKANKLVRSIFGLLGVKPTSVMDGLAPKAAAPQQALPIAAPGLPPPASTKKKLCEHISQNAEGEFEPLSTEEYTAALVRYKKICGDYPPYNERPTKDQLGALKAILAKGDAPYMDFGIVGPYGKRATKRRKFSGKVQVDGQWVSKLLHGPADYESWLASWNVFKVVVVMLEVASLEHMNRYAQGISTLNTLFAKDWPMIMDRDDIMRSEEWEAMKFEFELDPPAGYNPSNPWAYIITSSSYTKMGPRFSWWQNFLTVPLLSDGSAQDKVTKLEGIEADRTPPALMASTPKASAPSNRPSKVKTGKGLCRDYNKNKAPCNNTSECPRGFAHVCSTCGGAHAAVSRRACRKALSK